MVMCLLLNIAINSNLDYSVVLCVLCRRLIIVQLARALYLAQCPVNGGLKYPESF